MHYLQSDSIFFGENAKIQIEDLQSNLESDVVVLPLVQVLQNRVTSAAQRV